MENKKEVSKGYTLFKTVFYALLTIIISLLMGFVLGFAFGALGYNAISEEWAIALGALSTVLAALYVIKSIRKDNNIVIKDRNSLKKLNFKYLLGILLIGLSLSLSLDYLLIDVLKMAPQEPIMEISFSLWGLITILFIVVIAPIFEEIIYRFGIIEKMETKFSTVTSILVASVLFTVVHFYGLSASISVFILAVVIGLIYAHTRNLIYVIFLHFVNNIYAVVQQLAINENPSSFFATFPSSLTHLAILIVILILGGYLLYSQKEKVKYIKQ